jgi:hypothetical protein
MGRLWDCSTIARRRWSRVGLGFGRLRESKVHDEDGLVWFETPVARAFRLVLTREQHP